MKRKPMTYSELKQKHPRLAKLYKRFMISIVVLVALIGVLVALVPDTDVHKAQVASEQQQQAETQKVKDNTIDRDDYIDLRDYAQTIIKANVLSPSTAKFQGGIVEPLDGWDFLLLTKNKVQISSVVDSQNAFGAMIRNSFTMTACQIDGHYETGSLTIGGTAFNDSDDCLD